jgi:predicted GIY-YIG superfamily endonuclease
MCCCACDGTLYCGITNDLTRRISQHNAGKGARYTRGRGPVKVLRTWPQKEQIGGAQGGDRLQTP